MTWPDLGFETICMLCRDKIGMLVFCHCYNKLLQIWCLKITQVDYFIVSAGQDCKWAQLVSLLWVSHCQVQGVSLLGNSEKNPLPSSFILLAESSSLQLQDWGPISLLAVIQESLSASKGTYILWLKATFILQTSNGSLGPSLQISPMSPSASSLFCLPLLL